jgi:hypothetical protein
VIAYPYEGLRWCFTTPEAAEAFLGALDPSDQAKRLTVEPTLRE